ncbi:unnamed protein product [marine sediment metagenome]|uniref:Uncharacterized protein n=1 Tax=marine sediment metagenome TaxID=412755 RepID=X0V867_9ZZZZ
MSPPHFARKSRTPQLAYSVMATFKLQPSLQPDTSLLVKLLKTPAFHVTIEGMDKDPIIIDIRFPSLKSPRAWLWWLLFLMTCSLAAL